MSEHTNDAVVIRNLRFTYPEGHTAIHNVSLTVARGETVAIIGPNGAGKSTLLHHIIGLLRQESGTIRVAGYDVVPEQYQAVRRRVGYVFQDPDDQLFSPSLAEDVAFGPMYLGISDEEIGDRVDRALQAVGLESLGDRAPHRLSEGEKRLAALATVLSYDPDIFVLDEPTANLDPKNRRRLLELLRNAGRTLLVATHDLDLAWELCERSVLLRNGRVVADGLTRRLLADAGLLEANDLELPLRLQGVADADGESPGRR
jgi:cobalt/nickel transport system ATP-binding protein